MRRLRLTNGCGSATGSRSSRARQSATGGQARGGWGAPGSPGPKTYPADVVARALVQRATVLRQWQLFLNKYAVLLIPVSAELPFPDGLDLQDNAAFQRVWESQFLLRATPTLGLPAMTVSTGLVGQTPVGVQIVAGRYREDLCLRAGEAIEARGTPPAPIDPLN